MTRHQNLKNVHQLVRKLPVNKIQLVARTMLGP